MTELSLFCLEDVHFRNLSLSSKIYLACFFLNMFGRELNLDLNVLDTLKDSIELLSSCLELSFLASLPPVVLFRVLDMYFSHGAFLCLEDL